MKYLHTNLKKDTIVFLFSDFFSEVNYEKALTIAANKFKLIAIQIKDVKEQNIDGQGLIRIFDKENNSIKFVDISPKFLKGTQEQQNKIKSIMTKNFVHFIDIEINENYLMKLKLFFDNLHHK